MPSCDSLSTLTKQTHLLFQLKETLQIKRWKFPLHWWENYTLYHYHHGGFVCGDVLHHFECVITTSTWWSALTTIILISGTFLSKHLLKKWSKGRFFDQAMDVKVTNRAIEHVAIPIKK